MKKLLLHRPLYVYIAVGVIVIVGFMAFSLSTSEPDRLLTTTIERGTVERLVSVSGVIQAKQRADLSFSGTGIVSQVFIEQGDVVQPGDTLVTLESNALLADRQDALATLNRATANRDELLFGADSNTRAAASESVKFKQTSLETIRATQADLVQNAYRTLLSSGLTAVAAKSEEEAVPPIVSGTYTCDTEGTYTITTYASAAQSGYSYRATGIETDVSPVSTEQPGSLGNCGLSLLFDKNSRYGNTTWTISIPNLESPDYVRNRNAYSLATTQAASAIAVAEQDLALAQANATNSTAPARTEAIARANADIASANARVARIDAQIDNRSIVAPFAGTIVSVDVLPGEAVGTTPVVTLLTDTAFELTARIPEIDIGKLAVGQPVRATFDARPDTPLRGLIDLLSPQATEIDGVAYYEAIILLDEIPDWIRSGLNADVDIITDRLTDALRIPRRFITKTDDGFYVLQKTGNVIATSSVQVVLEGNDGYKAITGLREGDVIIAP